MDGTLAEIDSTGPAFEFNWGALPRVQLHVIAPWGSINPSNHPICAPGGMGPSAFGSSDMEHTGEQFLFCYGHSVAAQTEQYAYVGLYWTWGKDKKKPDSGQLRFPEPMNTPGVRPMNEMGFP